MTIRIDPLIERMVKYFDQVLWEVDEKNTKGMRERTRVRTMLVFFEMTGCARPVKRPNKSRVWTATTRLIRILGPIALEAQPHPARDVPERESYTFGRTLTEKEERYWEYFENHLYEITAEQIGPCCEWVKTDLQLVKSWGDLSSKRAQTLLKVARLLCL